MRVIEQQGAVVMAYDPDHRAFPPVKSPKRGDVTNFSRKSRRRLMILLNRLDYTQTRAAFLTLTFSGIPTPKEAKRALKQFRMRLARKFPGASAVWRMEFQERGAIHFHLIIFAMPFWPQRDIQHCWEECTHEEKSIVHINALRSRRKVLYYASKYIAKVEKGDSTTSLDLSPYQHTQEPESIGRVWGWINYEALPLADKHVIVIADAELERYLWWAIRAQSEGRCGNDPHVAMLFCEEAQQLLEWVKRHSTHWAELPSEGKCTVEVVSTSEAL